MLPTFWQVSAGKIIQCLHPETGPRIGRIFWVNDSTIIEFGFRVIQELCRYNSSHPTQPHSIIPKYSTVKIFLNQSKTLSDKEHNARDIGRHSKWPLSWIFLKIHIRTRSVTIVWDFYLKWKWKTERYSTIWHGWEGYYVWCEFKTTIFETCRLYFPRCTHQHIAKELGVKDFFSLAWGLKYVLILFCYEN